MSRNNQPFLSDIANLVHGYTDLSGIQQSGPVIIERGEGVRVFDSAGKGYIEAAAGMWCTALGFSELELVDAAVEQLNKLPYYHTLASRSVNPAIELAEKLAELVPIDNAHIYLAVTGSEANDFLVKFLWYYNNAIGRPLKKKMISRQGGYHGATVVASSLTGLTKNHGMFDVPLPGFLHTADPHFYRHGLRGETEEEYVNRIVDELEAMIIAENPETIMAFMAEPVTGGGGVVIPPPTYYGKIQELLKRYDIAFIADEVITGFGRTGEMFGCQTFGISPDAMTMGKALSSAYQPISAIAMSDDIYQGLVKGNNENGHYFGHGQTYSGHPVAAAVALKVLEIFESRNIVEHVNTVSGVFTQRMQSYLQHPLVGDVRSVGLIGAVELVAGKSTKNGFDPQGMVSSFLKQRCETHGLIVRPVQAGDGVAFCPPLIISEEEIDEMFNCFDLALEDTTRWVEQKN
ncbi:MAG: aminotransferase [bacterium]|nr:aminotransferase class III-fold pyridoxal phosphate-dependent enzyme [Gammaproteobacteria bacterium]HIL95954.1 aminotransferase class III-fold pyridoxal phosphate-dependent enzyme [Pseudomonadales bacterium]